MTSTRTYRVSTVVLGIGALVHALLTWPIEATVALFLGGVVVAGLAERVAVVLGWLEHDVGIQIAGVPLYVLPGWTAIIYAAARIAGVGASGWVVVPIAAALATAYDVAADNSGVEDGLWRYPEPVPGPRHGDVPWVIYGGWFVISAGTVAMTVPFL